MIGIDTNILARFYVDDPNDPEAKKQRPIAKKIMAESLGIFIPLTVILELEWVLRAFYRFSAENFIQVVEHLLGLANVNIEDWSRVVDALELHANGIDFADALHLCGCSECEAFLTFDNKRFAGRMRRIESALKVVVPEN